MKIQIQSSLGVITSDELDLTKQDVISFVWKSYSGELDLLRFKADDKWTYVPKNILINSIITIIE